MLLKNIQFCQSHPFLMIGSEITATRQGAADQQTALAKRIRAMIGSQHQIEPVSTLYTHLLLLSGTRYYQSSRRPLDLNVSDHLNTRLERQIKINIIDTAASMVTVLRVFFFSQRTGLKLSSEKASLGSLFELKNDHQRLPSEQLWLSSSFSPVIQPVDILCWKIQLLVISTLSIRASGRGVRPTDLGKRMLKLLSRRLIPWYTPLRSTKFPVRKEAKMQVPGPPLYKC